MGRPLIPLSKIAITTGEELDYKYAVQENESQVTDFSDFPTKEEIEESVKPIEPKQVNEYTFDGLFVATYDSAREAAEKCGFTPTTVRSCCEGHNNKLKDGRIFLYRGDDISKRMALIEAGRKKPNTEKFVDEYTLNGRFLFTYSTLTTAARTNKLPSMTVSRCIRGQIPFAGNRIFLHYKDDVKKRLPAVKEKLKEIRLKSLMTKGKHLPIDVYTLDGTFIKSCISCSEAAREFNIHVSNVTRCCKGEKTKHHYTLFVKDKIYLYTGASISDRLELIKQRNK